MNDNEMKVFVIDVETGGVNPETDGLCSITMKEYRKNNVLNFFIKPTKDMVYHQEAFNVNGLSNKFLRKNGITEKQAIKLILDFIKGDKFQILGHNTNFDYRFLKALFDRHGYEINDYVSYRLRDTQAIGMFLNDCGLESYESFSLGNMYEVSFGNSIRNAHSSLGDVKATERLYKYFVDKIERIK